MMTFNAKEYGAKGDGATDDRAAIQAAIDAAHAAGGGTVYLPPGEYRVSGGGEPSDGALLLKDNVYLQGAGMGQTVIKMVDGWNQNVTGMVRSPFAEETSNFGMSDLTLDGNRANTPAGVKIDGWFNGFAPGREGADRNVTLERVEVREMSGYGFDPHEQTFNLTIRDSVAHHNGLDGFVADYQIDGLFENNVAYANDRHGFNVVTSTYDFTMRNNVAYDNGGNGVVVQRGSENLPSPHDILIDGGKYYDNDLEGVLIKMSDDITLQNAEVYGNGRTGVRVQGAEGTQILNNQIRDNAQSGPFPEVAVQAFDDSLGVSGQVYNTSNTLIEGNTINGSANSTFGVEERGPYTDFTTVRNNTITEVQNPGRLVGVNSTAHTTQPTEPADAPRAAEEPGGPSSPSTEGSIFNDQLVGGEAGETFTGGAGRDSLTGGGGADTFRFGDKADSYRNPQTGVNNVDTINDFTPGTDRIDVSALGYSGLGTGTDGTLTAVLSADGGKTYIRDYRVDESGNRFEITLQGNQLAQLSADDFIFAQTTPPETTPADMPSEGTTMEDDIMNDALLNEANAPVMAAAAEPMTQGSMFNDRLVGGEANETFTGGAGRDTLTGGGGADIFRFSDKMDSYRNTETKLNSVDTITDFTAGTDRIDVSALGYTGLGNGTGGTLTAVLSSDGSKTYIRDYTLDEAGNRFEIVLQGNQLAQLSAGDFVFAAAGQPEEAPPVADIPVVQAEAEGEPETEGEPEQEGKPETEGTSEPARPAQPSTVNTQGSMFNDRLTGSDANETFVGGAGRDTMTGGGGSDIFRFSDKMDSYRNTETKVNSVDTITDFTAGTDRIDVSALGYTGLGNGTGGTLTAVLSSDGSKTYIRDYTLDEAGNRFEIVLQGNQLTQLSAADFTFAASAQEPGVPDAPADLPTVEMEVLGGQPQAEAIA